MIPRTVSLEWIQQANKRPIGHTEFRQVKMTIGDKKAFKELEIRTLRKIQGDISWSLFCVIKPRALANINYVVREQRGCMEPFDIQLYLPYVMGTLRNLPSDRRREGHLGSDFSYDDLRVWQYEQGHKYQTIEENTTQVRVRGMCVANPHLVRHGAAPFDLLIEPESAFVRGVDYFSSDGSTLIRQYRADRITDIDHISIAEQMTMHDLMNDHTTIISLERAWYDREIESDVFNSSFRKHTFDYLAAL